MDAISTTSVSVRTFLECQICLEAFKPPIYVCHKGHSICSVCIMRVKRCPTCRHLYTGTRNFLVENICETLRAVEGFGQSGSDTADAIAEAQNELRPITCYLSQNGCQNSSVEYFDYIQHLRSTHQVEFVLGSAYIRKFEIKDKRVIQGIPGDTFIFNYMSRNFLVIAHEDQGHAWFWVALHGSDEDASNFRVDMSLGTSMKRCENCRQEHEPTTKCVQIKDPFRKWSGKVFSTRNTASEVREECLLVPCGGVHSRLFEASGPGVNGRHLYLAVRIEKIPESDKEDNVSQLPTFAVPGEDGVLPCCRPPPPATHRNRNREQPGRSSVGVRLRLIGSTSSYSMFGGTRNLNLDDSTRRGTLTTRTTATTSARWVLETVENPVPEPDNDVPENNVPVSTSRINLTETSPRVLSRLPSNRFGSCAIS